MFRIVFTILLLFSTGTLSAQEICNNGIDDDGDGLIDLLDEECQTCGEKEIFIISDPYQIVLLYKLPFLENRNHHSDLLILAL